jgi:hypothetical protein
MEEAAALAMARNVYSYTYFVQLLEDRNRKEPVIHENLRGKDYFKGDTHV